MRHRPTGQEKDEAIADKQIKEKQSQVLLAQRVQHIKRLRQARREEIVQTEWYAPKQPNHDWRNAFAEGAAGLSTAAVGGSAEAPVVDEVSEMIVLKAERCVPCDVSTWVVMGGCII